MKINSINQYNHRNSNPNFGQVKNIKFTEEFDPYQNTNHLKILKAFQESEAIKKCCQENDVNIKFNHKDIDVFEHLNSKDLTKYQQQNIAKYKNEHIHTSLISITDAKETDKNYLILLTDSDKENDNTNKMINKIKNLRPDFYTQDQYNKFITPKYIADKLLSTIKSW